MIIRTCNEIFLSEYYEMSEYNLVITISRLYLTRCYSTEVGEADLPLY